MMPNEYDAVARRVIAGMADLEAPVRTRANMSGLLTPGPNLRVSERRPIQISLYFYEDGAGDRLWCSIVLSRRVGDSHGPSVQFRACIHEGVDLVEPLIDHIAEPAITEEWIIERSDAAIRLFMDMWTTLSPTSRGPLTMLDDASGRSPEDAMAFVPHGSVRLTTVGDIESTG